LKNKLPNHVLIFFESVRNMKFEYSNRGEKQISHHKTRKSLFSIEIQTLKRFVVNNGFRLFFFETRVIVFK